MAKATAHCRCKKCGNEFIREKKCFNRKDADEWEFWAENNFDLCGKCYGQEQREAEAAKDLYVDVRLNSAAAFNTDVEKCGVIAIVFGGNIEPHKDVIKALGGYWTTGYPDNGVLGDLLGMSYKASRLTIFCGLDELDEKLKHVEKLGAKLNSMPSDTDIALYSNMAAQRKKNEAEKEEKKRKALEELGNIPPWPDDISALWPKDAKWNCKFYGRPKYWNVYFSGQQVYLTDDQKERMEEVYKKRMAWNERKKEIEKKYENRGIPL